jgi:hypothetical protein
MNKKREHEKKLMYLQQTGTSETCNRGINELKKGYQPTTNLLKDEMGDLLADSHSASNRC